MSRYLTPAKIALLALVRLYCSPYFPVGYTLQTLSFISATLLPNVNDETEPALLQNLKDFEKKLRDEQNHLWLSFTSELCRLNDLDSLFTLCSDLMSLFGQQALSNNNFRNINACTPTMRGSAVVLSKTSLIGTFVRRANLEFERLQFHDVMHIWRKFEAFQEPLLEHLPARESESWGLDVDKYGNTVERLHSIIQQSLGGRSDPIEQSSAADIERLLDFHIQKMQKYGARFPEQSKRFLKNLLKSSNVSQSGLSHYFLFLDSWYSGDHRSAFESLHQYYDYALSNKDRSNYQYALLNMAILEADFSCFREAIDAMEEAIATARENKDIACLNFCLLWLHHIQVMERDSAGFTLTHPALGFEDGGLGYVKTTSKDGKSWSICSSALLSEARQYLANGHRPLKALERIYESSSLNVRHGLWPLMSSQCLMQSSVLERLGLSDLANSYNSLIEDCYRTESTIDSVMTARCRSAHQLANNGYYDTAILLLETTEGGMRHNFKVDGLKIQHEKTIRLKRALHRDELNYASTLLELLTCPSATHIPDYFQIRLQEIAYLRRRNDLQSAFMLVAKLMEVTESKSSDICQRIQLMTSKALLFHTSGEPQKGLSVALRALTIAYRARVAYVLWEAIGVLVVLLINLREFQAAVCFLSAIVYQATECGDVALMTLLQDAFADAWMGLASIHLEQSKTQIDSLNNALHWAKLAEKSYRQLEEKVGRYKSIAKICTILYSLGESKKAGEMEASCSESAEHTIVAFG